MKDLRNQALDAKQAVVVLVAERRSASQEAAQARLHDTEGCGSFAGRRRGSSG